MPDKLYEDLDDILITGAGKSEIRTYLLSKGYDAAVIENELNKIPFAKDNNIEDKKPKPATMKTALLSVFALIALFFGLKSYFLSDARKPTYAQINVQICNTSKTNVVVETNISKTLSVPFNAGGCLGISYKDGMPLDYLSSEKLYIKISANGKSKTDYMSIPGLASSNNIISRAEIQSIPGKKGFFSNEEIQNVGYTITEADVAECK